MESPSTTRPRGKASVKQALVSAATQLFAARGPAAVGVREIAREAGVNHGLVHRHFGSKQGLLRAVMTRLADEQNSGLGDAADERLVGLLSRAWTNANDAGLHWRILARSILDGEDPGELQESFPVVNRLLEAARRERPGPMSPEAFTVCLVSTGLGLMLFGPFLRAVIDCDEEAWRALRLELLLLASSSLQESGAGQP